MADKKREIFEIKVYGKDNKVVKTCQAVDASLKFGAIRKVMALLNIDDINDTGKLLKTIYGAWDELTAVLSQFFPDMTDEDWDNVLIDELVPVVFAIIKSTLGKIMTIPSDSKN